MSDNFGTNLVISGDRVAPYATRGATQMLEPIAAASYMRRTVNGALSDLANTQFRKYQSTITCNDVEPPAFASMWQGMTVTVDCITELGYHTASGAAGRTVVTGSSRVEGAYTYFRPQLTMKITGFSIAHDEYGHMTSWQATLEEI